MKDVD